MTTTVEETTTATATTVTEKQTLTVWMRPAPRLPKLLALAAIYWAWWEEIKAGLVDIELKPVFEGAHPPIQVVDGRYDWSYHLDCCGNDYRKRGLPTELEVVIADFEMNGHDYTRFEGLLEMAQAHNSRVSQQANPATTRNAFNKKWGSLGFFSGSAWALILDVFRPTPDGIETLSQLDFIRMTIEVIVESLMVSDAKKNGKTLRSWGEATESRVIQRILDMRFQGQPLKSGNFTFATLSGYIRDLWMNGKSEDEIEAKLQPWLNLWRLIEQKLADGAKVEPHYAFGLCHDELRGVAFDFSFEGIFEGADNPLLHKGQLSRVPFAIVKKADGHVGIFARGFTDASMKALADALNAREPGLWFYEGGAGIYNGSNSRPEVGPSNIPVDSASGACLIRLAQNYLHRAPKPEGHGKAPHKK